MKGTSKLTLLGVELTLVEMASGGVVEHKMDLDKVQSDLGEFALYF